MSNNNNSSSGGIDFLGLLTIVFIVLKLCNLIAWSWWWVLSPVWIPIAIVCGLFIVSIVVKATEARKARKRYAEKYPDMTK